MSSLSHPIFTIGHSTHAVETFAAILKHYHIEVVVDVRAVPYSRYAPQFNREQLRYALCRSNIQYLYLGDCLGIYATNGETKPTEVDLEYVKQLITNEPFQVGLERIIQGATRYRIALMCAEEDPADCHRALLIGRAIVERGFPVQHIRASRNCEPSQSYLESHQTLLKRIENVRKTKISQAQLELHFSTKEEYEDPLLARAARLIRARWLSLESNRARQHESSPTGTSHPRLDDPRGQLTSFAVKSRQPRDQRSPRC
jgi:uncharacterized protein (DUF488 family)